ncbi:MAG: glycosyltransferase [Chloroflexota bacterium]
MSTVQRVSVVVASQSALAQVERCLAALEAQRQQGIGQIILVGNTIEGIGEAVRESFPSVEIVDRPSHVLVPELWAEGVGRSREAVIALTTADMLPDPGWVAAILRQYERASWAGVGGVILPSPGLGSLDAAVYWLRYHRFASRQPAGAVRDIAGDNGSYRRQELIPYLERIARDGFWEYELNQDLGSAGKLLCLEPDAVVRYQGGESFAVFARQRLTHGRRFGAERFARATGLRRWLLLAAWPLTPAAMLMRISRGVVAAGAVGGLGRAVPPLLGLVACWSTGELLGYLSGASHALRSSARANPLASLTPTPTRTLARPPAVEPTSGAAAATDDHPTLSVVIASVNGPDYLDACLAALSAQHGTVLSEVVVADSYGPATAKLVAEKYPHVRLYSFAERLTIPQLRAAAIAQSRGDLIVMTEDHCVPAQDWYERIVATHQQQPYLAIGGAIENAATARLVDWAAFLCEYSAFVRPLAPGVAHDIPGPNVAYKRAALEHIQDLLDDGRWENFLHARLEERGFELYQDPSVVVYHRKFFSLGEFLSQRYHYGRGFAGMRVQRAPLWRKAVFAAGSPVLPPVILWRLGSRLFGRRRHRLIFLCALPQLALFTLSWSLGELVGYVLGPGDSLAKVE